MENIKQEILELHIYWPTKQYSVSGILIAPYSKDL